MPSIGKDLVKIRKHLGYTIEDIQYETKIPVSTLRTIEDDTIFTTSQEGKTYIRSFIRSYGRALQIDDNLMIKALDQEENGNYNHLLLQPFPSIAGEETLPPKPPGEEDSAGESDLFSEDTDTPEPLDVPSKDSPASKEKHLSEDKDKGKSAEEGFHSSGQDYGGPEKSAGRSQESDDTLHSPSEEPQVSNVNWADLGKKIHREKKQTPLWIVGVVILLIILGVTGYFLNEQGYFDFNSTSRGEITTPEPQQMNDSFSLELDEPEQQPSVVEESRDVNQLSDTLYITVYAAFDNLSPVRIWSDLKPRLDPYWLEQGTAMNFEFRDSVQIRGPYNNMLLFLNGQMIENFVQTNYNEESDLIVFPRSYFTADPGWADTSEINPPDGVSAPDTVIFRPVF